MSSSSDDKILLDAFGKPISVAVTKVSEVLAGSEGSSTPGFLKAFQCDKLKDFVVSLTETITSFIPGLKEKIVNVVNDKRLAYLTDDVAFKNLSDLTSLTDLEENFETFTSMVEDIEATLSSEDDNV